MSPPPASVLQPREERPSRGQSPGDVCSHPRFCPVHVVAPMDPEHGGRRVLLNVVQIQNLESEKQNSPGGEGHPAGQPCLLASSHAENPQWEHGWDHAGSGCSRSRRGHDRQPPSPGRASLGAKPLASGPLCARVPAPRALPAPALAQPRASSGQRQRLEACPMRSHLLISV